MCKIGGSISNIEMYKKLESKENVGIKKQASELKSEDSISTITKMPNSKDEKQVGSYKKDQSSEMTDSIKSKFDKMFTGGIKEELSKSKDSIKGELKSNDKNGEIKQHEGGLKENIKNHSKEEKINSHEGGLKEKLSHKDSIKGEIKEGLKSHNKEGKIKSHEGSNLKKEFGAVDEKFKDLKMTPDQHVEKQTLEMTPEKEARLKEMIQELK